MVGHLNQLHSDKRNSDLERIYKEVTTYTIYHFIKLGGI